MYQYCRINRIIPEADKVRFPSGTPTMIINQSTGESTKGIVEPATEGAITFRITAPLKSSKRKHR